MLAAACGGDETLIHQRDPETGRPLPPGIEWMELSGGDFRMGDGDEDDAPEVTVTLSAFSISLREVSYASYIHFLNAAQDDGWIRLHPHRRSDACGDFEELGVSSSDLAPAYPRQLMLVLARNGGCDKNGEAYSAENQSWIGYDTFRQRFVLLEPEREKWPVNWISWYGAHLYARFFGLTLPSEAQWESAARAGQQLDFPTSSGQIDPTKANYRHPDAPGHPQERGAYPPNPYGLFDLAGNLAEWAQDYYSPQFYQDGRYDPVNRSPGTEGWRVMRGGGWHSPPSALSSAIRARQSPQSLNSQTGFRVVRP